MERFWVTVGMLSFLAAPFVFWFFYRGKDSPIEKKPEPKDDAGEIKTTNELLYVLFGKKPDTDIFLARADDSKAVDWARINLEMLKRASKHQSSPAGIALWINEFRPEHFFAAHFCLELEYAGDGEYWLWYRDEKDGEERKMKKNLDTLKPGEIQNNLQILEWALEEVPNYLKKTPQEA